MSIENIRQALERLGNLIASLKERIVNVNPVIGIIIHHSASLRDATTLKDIDGWHRQRNFTKSSLGFFIGYQYVIFGNGKIVQTRLDTEEGCHTKGYNKRWLGICLTGNTESEYLSQEQLKSLQKLVSEKIAQYEIKIENVKGHRDFTASLCPGHNLYLSLQTYKITGRF